MKNLFFKHFQEVLIPEIQKAKKYSTPMRVSRLEKIVLSMSVKQVIQDKKALADGLKELYLISGQKPVITKAKKSVSSFKIRKGMPIGVKVTLRKDRMYAFLYRLIKIVLPRVRDFQGLNAQAFDGQGNYNLGIKEEIVFPEIDYDKIKFNKGLNVTFVLKSKDKQESFYLLKKLGLPMCNQQ